MMRPETEVELAEMIAGAEGPLAICGGGTRGFDPLLRRSGNQSGQKPQLLSLFSSVWLKDLVPFLK